MILDFERYKSILEESAYLLAGSYSRSVPIRPICRQLGISGVRRGRLEAAKSLLVDAGLRPTIILNTLEGESSKEGFTRYERFLIAHELGHLVLHQHGAKNPFGPNEYWKVEKLCDEFARRLLIPDQVVRRLLGQTRPTALQRLHAVHEVVITCGVHWAAAASRVSELTNDTVFFRLAATPAGAFRIVVSTDPQKRGIRQLIKPGTSLHEALAGSGKTKVNDKLREIEGELLHGIGGIREVRSAAQHGLRVAVLPA
jgi:hypothetical protein